MFKAAGNTEAAQVERTFSASWRQKHKFGGLGYLVGGSGAAL